VLILRGGGRCLVGGEVRDIGLHDLVTVPPWAWHQFRANAKEPLGFLCLVNAERDRPQLPSDDELTALKGDPEVRAFLEEQ
jgi:mannose-6-phosphate isomerase-like protein (cupin superfamily)